MVPGPGVVPQGPACFARALCHYFSGREYQQCREREGVRQACRVTTGRRRAAPPGQGVLDVNICKLLSLLLDSRVVEFEDVVY